jgi:hypothetical protein
MVLMNDTGPVSIQSIERTPKHAGIYLPLDIGRSSEGEPGSWGPGSKPGNGKIDKKTARKYQDVELQHK